MIEILGRHCGDGSCTYSKGTYRIRLQENLSLIQQHSKDLLNTFGIRPVIVRKDDNFVSDVKSKTYFRILTEIFNIPTSNKTYTVNEPEIIRKSPLNIRKYFARGLIDTDGSIYYDKSRRGWTLEFHSINENLILSVFEILSKLGFNPRTKISKYSKVEITGKLNLERYLKIVGSSNYRIYSKMP